MPNEHFGRSLLLVTAANIGVFNTMTRNEQIPRVQRPVFLLLVMLTCSMPMYFKMSGVPAKYRRLWAHIVVLGFTTSHGFSVMSNDSEHLVLLSSLFVTLIFDQYGPTITRKASSLNEGLNQATGPSDLVGFVQPKLPAARPLAPLIPTAPTLMTANASPDVDFFKRGGGFQFFSHTFADVLLEAHYSTQLFDASYRLFCYLMAISKQGQDSRTHPALMHPASAERCAYLTRSSPYCRCPDLAIIFIFMYYAPGLRFCAAVGVPALAGVSLARRALESMEDRQQARRLYSQAVALEGTFSAIAILSFCYSGIVIKQISIFALVGGALLLMIFPTFWWISAVHDRHRITWAVAMASTFAFAPRFSVVGPPIENIAMITAIILGELFGYTIIQLHRASFLSSDVGRRAAEAQERARRAERATAQLEVERSAVSTIAWNQNPLHLHLLPTPLLGPGSRIRITHFRFTCVAFTLSG
jgi:hypothetical protein